MAGYDRRYYLKKAWSLFPGIISPASAPFLRAHYAARAHRRGVARAIADAFIALAFHAWIPVRAAQVRKRHGLDRGWSKRARTIAHARFVDPNDIALFRIERAEEMDGYIRRFEDAGINKLLNPAGWQPACVLADKLRFAERCAETGLPHAATIAQMDATGVMVRAAPGGRELVLKPADGEGGDGVRMLGAVADEASLRRILSALQPGKGQKLVVQPRLSCHSSLDGLALSALPTARIVTMINEQGVAEPVSATFRCPSDPAASVDNMKAGGLIAPIDLGTGTLGLASRGYGGGDYLAHPVTQAPIAGHVLAHWEEALALVGRAHLLGFAEYRLIGWDMALTPNGPVLLEGNGKPGVLMPQRAARRGLGEGRYGELLAWHLARL